METAMWIDGREANRKKEALKELVHGGRTTGNNSKIKTEFFAENKQERTGDWQCREYRESLNSEIRGGVSSERDSPFLNLTVSQFMLDVAA